ncbi:MAG TPA: hypothetical protein VGX48_22360 [Pyrinomonadaceae bacterium]|jgi:hypothetical protein|nr:hypothetical protein [Pyrinomonadaceae bacterium]
MRITTLGPRVILALLLLTPPAVRAQTVALRGQVSAAVHVSADEAQSQADGAEVSVTAVDASTLAVTISGSGGEARVRLPVKLRSNVGYALLASGDGEIDVRLRVAEMKATGRFVHADALEALRLESPSSPTLQNTARPVALLSGPPISKAGTFRSPDNAIEVVLTVELLPRAGRGPWSTRLTLSCAPRR